MSQRPKDKRLPIYLTAEELQLIRIAAAYAGISMTAFAKKYVLDAAHTMIAEHTKQDDKNR